MPRYLIERSYPRGVVFHIDEIVDRNACLGVTWLYSYVSDDNRTVFDLYDAPSPEAVRTTCARNDLSVDRITEVRVLDPYSYVEGGGPRPGVERADPHGLRVRSTG